MSNLLSHRLAPNLISGITVGVLTVIVSVSFGSVIFSGELSSALPLGIGLMLLSSIVVSACLGSLSAYPALVASVQDTTVPALTLVAQQIVAQMPTATVETKLLTLTATISLTALVRGMIFWALGWFKFGGLIRFVPYPVIGGFLAATGVLLFQGAFLSLSGIDPLHLRISALFQFNTLLQWLPGLLFAITLSVLPRRINHFLTIPGLIVGAIALFYLTLALTGCSIAEAREQGWLLGSIPSGSLLSIPTFSALTQVDWQIVFRQIPSLAALWLVELIALLLNTSGIELIARYDLDLNYELKAAGIASITSGLSGGVGGFHVLSDTNLARQLGGSTRLVGWSIAAICLAFLLGGASFLSLFPKLIVVGIPLYLGLEFMYEWLYQAWFKFSRSDFVIIVLIVLVTATVGYLQGIGMGLIAAILLFVINYSSLSVTKRVSSGVYCHSNVVRSPEESRLLRQEGEQIYILELQGLIFFGTANKLLNQVLDRLNPTNQPVRFVILDFRLVSGLDSSTVLSFAKLKQIAQRQNIRLLFSNLSPDTLKRLQQEEVLGADAPLCQIYPDLDRALEWCEAQILQDNLEHQPEPSSSVAAHLETAFTSAETAQLMTYLKPHTVQEGDYLFRQGDPFDGLYFIGQGQISVELKVAEGQTKRIRTYTVGTMIGELGFYRKAPRSAAVIADKPSEIYFLSAEAFEQMEVEAPMLAVSFHRFVVNLLAERLLYREEELKNLLQ